MSAESSSSRRPSGPVTLRTPRVAEAVAAQLRMRIIQGDLGDGAELPTEAILLQEFPASRPSLREALRILETEGLVTVRRGKRGGMVVSSPTPATAAYHMGLLFHAERVPMTDLADARNLIEPLCAEQAARRSDHKKVGRSLRALNRDAEALLDDGPAFTDAAVLFHEALVDAAGNQTLRVIAGMLESVWSVQERGWAQNADREDSYPELALLKGAVKAHDVICDAIERGDAEAAARAAASHLDASQLYVASSPDQTVSVLDEYGSPRMSSHR